MCQRLRFQPLHVVTTAGGLMHFHEVGQQLHNVLIVGYLRSDSQSRLIATVHGKWIGAKLEQDTHKISALVLYSQMQQGCA